uniref:Uncharacterized protein n=1 Tax=Ciona intestinalis TaxID=7719 RepID=H2XP21_CIOIN
MLKKARVMNQQRTPLTILLVTTLLLSQDLLLGALWPLLLLSSQFFFSLHLFTGSDKIIDSTSDFVKKTIEAM